MRLTIDIDRKTLVGMLAGAVITVIVVVLLRGLFGGGGGVRHPDRGHPAEERGRAGLAVIGDTESSGSSGSSESEDDTTQVEEEEDVEEFVASQEPPDIAVPLGKGRSTAPRPR